MNTVWLEDTTYHAKLVQSGAKTYGGGGGGMVVGSEGRGGHTGAVSLRSSHKFKPFALRKAKIA